MRNANQNEVYSITALYCRNMHFAGKSGWTVIQADIVSNNHLSPRLEYTVTPYAITPFDKHPILYEEAEAGSQTFEARALLRKFSMPGVVEIHYYIGSSKEMRV